MAGSSYIDVAAAIKAAESAIKDKYAALAKVDIIRTDLRNAVALGVTTPEQKQWIEATFPIRERKHKGKPAQVVPDKAAA